MSETIKVGPGKTRINLTKALKGIKLPGPDGKAKALSDKELQILKTTMGLITNR